MAYPIGSPTTKVSDTEYQGTTPEGVQRALGSLYMNAGVIPGTTDCKVSGTTGWNYSVAPGTVFMWTSFNAKTGVLVPIEAVTLPVAQPSSGARTDVVYVGTDGVVRVAQGATNAPSGVVLDRRVIPAGASNTNASTSNWDKQYAIPAGASLGLLHKFYDPQGRGEMAKSAMTLGVGRFNLPTDRIIEIKGTHSGASIRGGTTPLRMLRWRVYVDGNIATTFFSSDYSPTMYPMVTNYDYRMTLSAGAHTVHYVQDIPYEGAFFVYGGGYEWPGNRFEVWDMGAAV